MKAYWIKTILRILISLCLLFGVYGETGFYTVSVLFLVLLEIEIRAYVDAKLRYRWNKPSNFKAVEVPL